MGGCVCVGEWVGLCGGGGVSGCVCVGGCVWVGEYVWEWGCMCG